MLELIATSPVSVLVPVTTVLPPTYRFSAMPAPPSTLNAPVVGLY